MEYNDVNERLEELKIEDFNNRSMIRKVKESIARLFSPIL